MIVFEQIAAALYLAAGIGSLLGVVLARPRMARGAVLGLALGAGFQALAFATLHRVPNPPPITDLAMAISVVTWMSVLFELALVWRLRVPALAVVVGPAAFLATFVASLRLSGAPEPSPGASGSWPHVHVLLAGAGFALLSVAGIAGLFFLVEHHRLKNKHPLIWGLRLPSLEALDRINALALAIGFPLLTLGLASGMVWLWIEHGEIWEWSGHGIFTAVAWAIYAGLVAARFGGHQGARQAAASAVAGFAFLLFAVVGVGVLV